MGKMLAFRIENEFIPSVLRDLHYKSSNSRDKSCSTLQSQMEPVYCFVMYVPGGLFFEEKSAKKYSFVTLK